MPDHVGRIAIGPQSHAVLDDLGRNGIRRAVVTNTQPSRTVGASGRALAPAASSSLSRALPPGCYEIEVRPGSRPPRCETVEVRAGVVTRLDLALEPNAAASDPPLR